MASGSSGRPNSGSKGYDFSSSDDILCSYEDYTNQDTSNGPHSDPPNKDFQKSRISRSSAAFPATNVYSQPEELLSHEVILTVERSMKKYADNLMRFLEGISSRLSQLELYCYNLDKSIGEMRSDLARDHGEAESKLKSVEKHIQEVHRSVQILRDKQELADTQKELAKLQLAQKESDVEDRTAVSGPESKKAEDVSDTPNTQLALALPSQVAPHPSHATVQQQVTPPPPPSQNLTQLPPYYLPSSQLQNPQAQTQPSYLSPDAQYRAPQLPPQGPQPSQTQVNQTPQTQQFTHYHPQWPPQASQPLHQPPLPPPSQPQPSAMQPQNQIRAPTPPSNAYSPYMGGQPTNAPPPEAMASSMPMQIPFPGLHQQGVSHADSMPYGYSGRPVQPQPSPALMKGGFPSQPGDGYATGGSHPSMTSGGAYMLYENEGVRPQHPPPTRYPQGGYPPPNPSLPSLPPPSSNALMIRTPSPHQFSRNHPYNELVDKLASMGYRGDHVVSVIQRLEESGQSVDFNTVLDRLNGHSSGGSQRGGW